MKDLDLDGIIIFILGTLVAGALFLGIIAIVHKSFKSEPKIKTINPRDLETEQKERARKTRDLQKKLMEEQRQKIRDYRK